MPHIYILLPEHSTPSSCPSQFKEVYSPRYPAILLNVPHLIQYWAKQKQYQLYAKGPNSTLVNSNTISSLFPSKILRRTTVPVLKILRPQRQHTAFPSRTRCTEDLNPRILVPENLLFPTVEGGHQSQGATSWATECPVTSR